ncbi:hypothetical protein Pla52n_51610 [Stieleria varia]|uniref:Uncharacterized protein n=1 Tax=Stieleria varia TaxID=2528005 RepID=A0A5C6AF98_9BACT|nr:hypothetical protein Pla52n_51610 [Stieleria varia]
MMRLQNARKYRFLLFFGTESSGMMQSKSLPEF